jgi:hypothetical protein
MYRSTSAAHGSAWGRALARVCGLVLCLVTSATAQYAPPVSPVPSTPPAPGIGVISLTGIGGVAAIGTTGFRLTFSAPYQRGAVWMTNKQPIAGGFQTTFQFRISNPGGIVQATPFGVQQGGDGFAFVIQNFRMPVVGLPAGFLGYHAIPNSLAVEFDTWWNAEAGYFDPNGNHISVHSRGTGANSVSESASLGQATAIPFLKDGATHVGRIDYIPGTLRVFMDDLTTPALTVPGLDLSSFLSLDNGSAWVGFTAGTGAAFEAHDILIWQFGQAGIPVTPLGPFPVTVTPVTPTPTTQPPASTTPPYFTFP